MVTHHSHVVGVVSMQSRLHQVNELHGAQFMLTDHLDECINILIVSNNENYLQFEDRAVTIIVITLLIPFGRFRFYGGLTTLLTSTTLSGHRWLGVLLLHRVLLNLLEDLALTHMVLLQYRSLQQGFVLFAPSGRLCLLKFWGVGGGNHLPNHLIHPINSL